MSTLATLNDSPLLLGGIVFLVGAFLFLAFSPGWRFKLLATLFGKISFPYKKAKLLSPAEKLFFSALQKALGRQFQLFAKVRIADAVEVVPLAAKTMHGKRAFFKISSKHLDFIICDPKSMETLAAIELDDKSHNQKDRQERDVFVDYVCQFAHIPLIRIPASNYYDYTLLRQRILNAIFPAS